MKLLAHVLCWDYASLRRVLLRLRSEGKAKWQTGAQGIQLVARPTNADD